MFISSVETTHGITHPPRWIVVCVLIVTYIITALPLRLCYRAKRVFPANVGSLQRGSLIIANHQSMVDPFVITMNLPFLTFLKLVPIYFPAAPEYMRVPMLGFIMRLLGCYSIGVSKQEKMFAFFHTRKLIQEGQTVFLFPEGRISRDNIQKFQRGIEFFFKEAPASMFIKISGFNKIDWLCLWKTRCKIHYGEVNQSYGMELKVNALEEYLKSMAEIST